MSTVQTTPHNMLESLEDAINWFQFQDVDNWRTSGFRTPALISKYPYGDPPSVRNYDYECMRVIVSECVDRRMNELRCHRLHTGRECRDLRGGRLLRHNLGESTNTDIPSQETGGFFDAWDMPPWDVWIALIVDEQTDSRFGYLVSWVPPQLCEIVDQSVIASFEENNTWLENLDCLGSLKYE